MSTFKYTAGLSNVGSYQVSGKPYMSTVACPASGSTNSVKIEFPYVTKEVTIANNITVAHGLIRVAMSAEGLQDNSEHFLIGPNKDGNGAVTFNVKCTEIWIMSDDSHTGRVSVFASLTNLPISRINNLSGSDDIVGNNWSGSVGVG